MGDTTTPAQADPFGDVNAELVDPRPAGFLAEVGAAQEAQADAERAIAQAGQDQMSGGIPLDMDPVSGEQWDDGPYPEAGQLTDRQERLAAADRVAELEAELTAWKREMVRTMRELDGARVIIEARDNRVAQLEKALDQRTEYLRTAVDAAEEYRMERDAARATIDTIARAIDPQDS